MRLDRRPPQRALGRADARWQHDAGDAAARGAATCSSTASKARARLGWTPRLGPRRRRSTWIVDWYRALRSRRATCARSRSAQIERVRRHGRTARSAMSRRPAASAARRSTHVFVDLGMSPLANAFLQPEAARRRWSRSTRCTRSSATSASWCSSRSSRRRTRSSATTPTSRRTRHLARALRGATPRWRSSASASARESQVVEIASNDGYLLQYFVERGVPVLGIEPAANVAAVGRARRASAPLVKFFGARDRARARRAGRQADLLIGNNVLAHVPDLNDFVAGLKILLAPARRDHDGVPAPAAPDRRNQFDTIYHEHFSYFSFLTVERVFARARPDAVRRRGAADARRLAAHLRAARRGRRAAGDGRVRASCAQREQAARLRPPRDLRRLRRAACSRRSASCSSS